MCAKDQVLNNYYICQDQWLAIKMMIKDTANYRGAKNKCKSKSGSEPLSQRTELTPV